MIILHGRGQSRSFRVLWALEEANLPFQYHEIKNGSAEVSGSLSKEYLSLNPQGKVPTFIDDGLVLTESGAILNYIATKSPGSDLIPEQDPKKRALYDQVCFFVLSDLEQPLWTNGKHRIFLPEEQQVSEVIPTTHWEFKKSLQALEPHMEGKKYALGDTFTMADILIAQTLNWAIRFKFDLPETFQSYRDRMYERSACKKAMLRIE